MCVDTQLRHSTSFWQTCDTSCTMCFSLYYFSAGRQRSFLNKGAQQKISVFFFYIWSFVLLFWLCNMVKCWTLLSHANTLETENPLNSLQFRSACLHLTIWTWEQINRQKTQLLIGLYKKAFFFLIVKVDLFLHPSLIQYEICIKMH